MEYFIGSNNPSVKYQRLPLASANPNPTIPPIANATPPANAIPFSPSEKKNQKCTSFEYTKYPSLRAQIIPISIFFLINDSNVATC